MQCDKVGYNNRSEAAKEGSGIARATHQSMRAYKCKVEGCGKWHLSSIKKKKLNKNSKKKLKYPFLYDRTKPGD